MLNVYRPVPHDLFAATPPVRSRRALRFFTTWYDAVAGVVILTIMALLIAPVAPRQPLMALWPAAYFVYISAMVAISRAPTLREMLHDVAGAVAGWLSWLVYGPPDASTDTGDERPGARGLGAIQITLAVALTVAALLFVITLGRAYRAVGLPLSSDVASWLLFVLPMLRVARYASMIWIGVLGALVLASDGAARLLLAGGADSATLRIVALHACWLTLVSLLPAITLRSLSEQRLGQKNAIGVVRAITALQPASESEFANDAATTIAKTLRYDEVNVLLATSQDDATGRGLRFLGAASQAGRALARDGYIIEQAQGITGWAAIHGQERLVNDVERDPDHLYLKHKSFPRTRAELAIPLTLGGAIIGVLDVQSERAYAFGEDDVELLHAIALHLAVALDNVQRLTRARGLAAVTQRIARRLLSQQDLRAALEQVVMTARETLRADSVALYPCDPEDERIGEPVLSGDFRIAPASAARVASGADASAVTRALREGQPRFETYITPAGATESASRWRSGFVTREGVQAAAILPLRVGGGPAGGEGTPLGVIFVNYHSPQRFSPEYREWSVALADLAALALQSAMLYQRVVEEERANTWIELHDGMGQDVSYGRMLLEQVLTTWTSDGALTPIDGEKLRNAHQFLHALQRQVTYLIEVWRERDTDDMWRDGSDEASGEARGLFGDLDEHAALVQRTLQMRCRVDHHGDDSAFTGSLRHDARMVAREAVYNAYRHGRASEALIEAVAEAGELRLCIRDNGSGFDTRRLSNKAHGMTSIQRRAGRHGGTFEIESSREPGRSGTTLRVVFRLAQAMSRPSDATRARSETPISGGRRLTSVTDVEGGRHGAAI